MNESSAARPRLSAARPRGATLMAVLACAALVTLGAMFFVWQRYQFVSLGFAVGELRQRQAALEERIRPLQVEAEYLSRPERIEAIARERLGMRPPAPGQVVVIEPGAEPKR
jgi:cell division protein FtsL